MEDKKRQGIQFTSLTLLETLQRKKLLKHLMKVKIDNDGYPVFSMRNTEKVAGVVATFMGNHDLKCDRSIDGEAWEYYKQDIIDSNKKPDIIITRNYKAVSRIFDEGLSCLLCKAGIDKNGKHFFGFYGNPVIAEIKREEDEKSRQRYEAKKIMETDVNTEMGKLIEKAMEESKNE